MMASARRSCGWLNGPQTGVVLAGRSQDGETRIACAVLAVIKAGGRAAVVVPHGLMHQWQREGECWACRPPSR
jgi:hypothetical protein